MNEMIKLSNNGKHEAARQNSAEWIFGVDRIFELIGVFTITASLIGLAATLVGAFHAPQVLLGSLLLTGCYAYRTKDWCALPGPQPKWLHIAMLLAIALFFRLPVYHYTLGAQDEGLYTSMAHHIARTGGIADRDKVMDGLKGTPYLQTYLHDNRIYEGDSPTLYLLGVYARERGTSHLVFQLYYLFPVWMAVVGGVVGSTVAVYALTFFALLSIVFFYRLALLLTSSHKAALLAGALLAVNPLHAFFSKFPVTEMPTLAFSLIGFTLLAGFWTASPANRRRRW